MITPAQDMLDNIRRKARLGEDCDCDDVRFLLGEMGNAIENTVLPILEYYEDDIMANEPYVPKAVFDANFELMELGLHYYYDWPDWNDYQKNVRKNQEIDDEIEVE